MYSIRHHTAPAEPTHRHRMWMHVIKNSTTKPNRLNNTAQHSTKAQRQHAPQANSATHSHTSYNNPNNTVQS